MYPEQIVEDDFGFEDASQVAAIMLASLAR
jgi:hypothetical protein